MIKITPEAESSEANLSTEQAPLPVFHERSFSTLFHWYLSGAILINLLVMFFDGHGGDLGFWKDWVRQLGTHGYGEFNGNYPPGYIHWLWVTAKIYTFLQMPFEVSPFLKFTTQIPVLITHLLLIGIIYQLLKRYSASRAHFHLAMALTAFNPALLLDGPVWGQVDVMPVVPALAAILISCHERWRIWAFPLYCCSLLIKFQMISFSPVMGIIFLRHWKTHLKGGLLSLLLIPLAFLPSIVTGNAIRAFELAYIEVLNQYGRTTMGAANIWILLTGNATPDTIVLFGISPDSFWAPVFTARRFGMICFAITIISLFLHAVYQLATGKFPKESQAAVSRLLFYAIACATAFFTFLPAMHERYIIPAVIMSLAYYAVTPGRALYPLALTFISTFNLLMTLGIKTNHMWPVISWLMLATCLYIVAVCLLPARAKHTLFAMFEKVVALPWLSVWVLLIALSWSGHLLYQRSYIHQPELASNQKLLAEYTPVYQKQDYGHLQINKSINGNPLTVGGKRYATGFGTHLNSVIDFALPRGATHITFIAGVDNEVETAKVSFQIWGDEQELWRSPIHYGSEKNLQPVEVDIRGIRRLSLRATALKSIGSGHVDWVNPIITFRENQKP